MDWESWLASTWPAQAGRAIWGGVTAPGDAYAGRLDPLSDEGIARTASLAGTTMLPFGMAPRGALAAGLARRRPAFEPTQPQPLTLQDVPRAGKTSPLYIGREAPEGARWPGIYKDPRQLAEEAQANIEPEHPALKHLFGVTRQDLYDIGQQGRRQGNIEPAIPQSNSYIGEGVRTRANAGRLIDALSMAPEDLKRGMDAWYVMDPAYQQMVKLVGREQAMRDYPKFNTFTSMASPGSDVLTEINRGTGAYMMAQRGQFPDYVKYAGLGQMKRGADFPEALRDVSGHPYHSTAHAQPMQKYLEGGAVDMDSAKVPLYIGASGVPETGFQTRWPVGDAHFTRAVGAGDVAAAAGVKNPGASMKMTPYSSMAPWFRDAVATPLGIEAVPGQARLWGLMAGQTGVDTPVGAPKLELLARSIWDRARRLGIDPAMLRDKVLTGEMHAWNDQSPSGSTAMG